MSAALGMTVKARVFTGDFEEALVALLGKDACGLSASTVGRLKEASSEEHTRWSAPAGSARRPDRCRS
jgi:putative transposase